MKYELGTMLFRRKKASCRCGDLFIVVENDKSKFGYKLLSFRKDGRVNVSWVESDTLNKLYKTIGQAPQIIDWLYIAKRETEGDNQ
jgi:hypothetical protein